jgi:hypothetical protein
VPLALKVLKVIPGTQVHKAFRVFKDPKVIRVIQARQVLLVLTAYLQQ